MAKNKVCGIYCIENIVNKKKYIGLSIDINRRIRSHYKSLVDNKHKNKFIQNAWNKYGEENFYFYVIEECDKENITQREMYYIKLYDTTNSESGYNLKGDIGLGVRSNNHYTEAMELAHNDRKIPILQIDLNGNIIKEWESASKASRHFNIKPSNIWGCCNLDNKYTVKGYIWIEKDKYNGSFNVKDYLKNSTSIKKEIVQLDFNYTLISEYVDIQTAAKINNISGKGIGACIRGNNSTYKDFIWMYKEDYENMNFNKIIKYPKRKVEQYSINGDFIKSWDSIIEASKELNIHKDSISNSCRGKTKTAGGFIWK